MPTRIRTRGLLLILLALALTLSACQPKATPTTPTAPPKPTATVPPPTATDTPEPTATPAPTATPTPEPITLTDGWGREITLAAPAQRAVSLAPSNTEILFAVGAGAQVVGRDTFSDYPTEALDLTDVGGSFGEYNTEAIVGLEPDLVLAADINAPEFIQSLEDLGVTVFVVGNPTDLEGMYANLETVGALTGHADEAAALAEELRARVDAVVAALEGVEEQPLVFYELDGSDPNAPWTPGPGTFITTLIEMAAAQNLGASLDSAWAQLSLEALLTKNPDVILLGDANWGVTPESVAQRAGWDALSAVQNGQVFPVDGNLFSRPGPRLVDGLETLAVLLHPDVFCASPPATVSADTVALVCTP